ncbi:phytoene desaturase family protein [Mameliella sp. AT18]|uniref:1-hydroxycarotenoid 3,4-desaturase CrtD n=1 Tax=Mameliella sp. AT18 TaxID=3028385 RepID=UPI0008410D13|nr:1-hydroxycarotenoid 3,4-desaturase CrtD [Mameliella sp. AT18]MDD9732110.1 phytoene desaturase family protein [Mameliella sp. AT18]ODM47645.1 methoxyneurosporene dehydrogenase [Ruegeria sp. PBVC088]
MTPSGFSAHQGCDVLIVGAGIGGLAAAARLAHAGLRITVVERAARSGGKMRCLPSPAGPVDAGPTVLTLRPVLDDLFTSLDERLDAHLELIRQPLIARHFWPDGSRLDLFDSEPENLEALRAFGGARAVAQFRAFCDRARALFEAFDGPVMRAANPSLAGLAGQTLRAPGLLRQMAPHRSLAALLDRTFDDPRLTQLFGRYATYVGASPYRAPALLSLIWQAEYVGVWKIAGGMHRLARALERIARTRGARFHHNAHVARIDISGGRARGVTLADGRTLRAERVLFNGDPRALATGALGPEAVPAGGQNGKRKRSLSAQVWAFAARARGVDLAHHNVFFRADPKPEFDALARGALVPDPTLYLCAMDRGGPAPPPDLERFEIIANAPPLPAPDQEPDQCRTRCFDTLARAGLRFAPMPDAQSLTTPTGFESLFPASQGALYGQSPEALMAAFQRPKARSPVPGLYLAGGGAHPGAGVPMAMLSARHAAEAILSDRTSPSPSRRTATPGGTSTASATAAGGRSASSPS